MQFSRGRTDIQPSALTRDVAFNRESMNDGHHISPFDNDRVNIGTDGIIVKLVQDFSDEEFKRIASKAIKATIGVNLEYDDEDDTDWEEMLQGGLQTALEAFKVSFEVQGVSRACTHQLVRSRRAAFHQQSMRASYYGDHPETRMPESVWRNPRARSAFVVALEQAHAAYRIACDENISYQDARYILPEGTDNYILCEYDLAEFIKLYAYRGCTMFQWEIVHVVREMRRLLVEAHPWLMPYIKISCQDRVCPRCIGSGKVFINEEWDQCPECAGIGMIGSRCTFQGWEQVEGQCDFPQAKEELRTFRSKAHQIKRGTTLEITTEKGS